MNIISLLNAQNSADIFQLNLILYAVSFFLCLLLDIIIVLIKGQEPRENVKYIVLINFAITIVAGVIIANVVSNSINVHPTLLLYIICWILPYLINYNHTIDRLTTNNFNNYIKITCSLKDTDMKAKCEMYNIKWTVSNLNAEIIIPLIFKCKKTVKRKIEESEITKNLTIVLDKFELDFSVEKLVALIKKEGKYKEVILQKLGEINVKNISGDVVKDK